MKNHINHTAYENVLHHDRENPYQELNKDSLSFLNDPCTTTINMEEREYYDRIAWLEEFIKRVLKSDEMAFRIEQEEGKKPVIKRLRFAKDYHHVTCGINRQSFSMMFPSHEQSPYLDLLFQAKQAIGFEDLPHGKPNSMIETGQFAAERFNNLITTIREMEKSKAFKNALRNRIRYAKENFDNSVKYIDALFEKHSRLLVLRIDLGYSNAYKRETSHVQAKADLDAFLNKMRKRSGVKEKLGYICKTEYGRSKGIHFHCLFFFDGQSVNHDVHWTNEIGKYWREIITAGAGVYYNCNAHYHRYRRLGIGVINHDDLEKRENLLVALAYLAKVDQYMRLCLRNDKGNRLKTFTKGEMPKPPHSKRGRPRRPPKHPMTVLQVGT